MITSRNDNDDGLRPLVVSDDTVSVRDRLAAEQNDDEGRPRTPPPGGQDAEEVHRRRPSVNAKKLIEAFKKPQSNASKGRDLLAKAKARKAGTGSPRPHGQSFTEREFGRRRGSSFCLSDGVSTPEKDQPPSPSATCPASGESSPTFDGSSAGSGEEESGSGGAVEDALEVLGLSPEALVEHRQLTAKARAAEVFQVLLDYLFSSLV